MQIRLHFAGSLNVWSSCKPNIKFLLLIIITISSQLSGCEILFGRYFPYRLFLALADEIFQGFGHLSEFQSLWRARMQRKPFCEDCKGCTGGTKKEGDPRRASVRTSWKILKKKILITQTLGGREEIWSRKTETIGEEKKEIGKQGCEHDWLNSDHQFPSQCWFSKIKCSIYLHSR